MYKYYIKGLSDTKRLSEADNLTTPSDNLVTYVIISVLTKRLSGCQMIVSFSYNILYIQTLINSDYINSQSFYKILESFQTI